MSNRLRSRLLNPLPVAVFLGLLSTPALSQLRPRPYIPPLRTVNVVPEPVQIGPQPEVWYPHDLWRGYRAPRRLAAPPYLGWRHPGSRELGIPRAYYMSRWERNDSPELGVYRRRTPRLADFFGRWGY